MLLSNINRASSYFLSLYNFNPSSKKFSLLKYELIKLIGGLRSSMGYLGSKDIFKLRNKPNFVKITKAGFYESMVHNVDVIKNDKKY